MSKQTKSTSDTMAPAGSKKNILGSGVIANMPPIPPVGEYRETAWEVIEKLRFETMSDVLHAMADILWEIDELDYRAMIYRDRDTNTFRVMLFEEIDFYKGDPKPKELIKFYDDVSIPDLIVKYGTMTKVEDQEGH